MSFLTFPLLFLALVASYLLKTPPYIISLANFALAIAAADSSLSPEDGGDTATVAFGVVGIFILNVLLDKLAKRYPGGIFSTSPAATTPTLPFSPVTTAAMPSLSGFEAARPLRVLIRQLKEELKYANSRIKTLARNELDALAEAKLFERLSQQTREQNSALVEECQQLRDERLLLRDQLRLTGKNVTGYWDDLMQSQHTIQCLKVDHANHIRNVTAAYAQRHDMDNLVQSITKERDNSRDELRLVQDENASLYTAIASITQDLDAAQRELSVMRMSYKRLDDVCVWYRKKSEGLLVQVQMLLKGIFAPFMVRALSRPSSTATAQPAPVVPTHNQDGDAQPSGAPSGLTSTAPLPADSTMATENGNAHKLSIAHGPSGAPSGPIFPLVSSTLAANGNAQLPIAYGPSGAPSGPIFSLPAQTMAANDNGLPALSMGT